MPTLAEINAQSNATLTRVERNHALEVLGVPLDSENTVYTTAEARFDALSTSNSDLNRTLRAVMAAYDAIGESMTELRGGSRGIYVKLADDRARQARNLRQIIFPPTATTMLDAEATTTVGSTEAQVSFVPIRYDNEEVADDEYAP